MVYCTVEWVGSGAGVFTVHFHAAVRWGEMRFTSTKNILLHDVGWCTVWFGYAILYNTKFEEQSRLLFACGFCCCCCCYRRWTFTECFGWLAASSTRHICKLCGPIESFGNWYIHDETDEPKFFCHFKQFIAADQVVPDSAFPRMNAF